MHSIRWVAVCVAAIVALPMIGMHFLRSLPIGMFVGPSYSVRFSKGLWVRHLATPYYERLQLLDTSDDYACFVDRSSAFNNHNLGGRLLDADAALLMLDGAVLLYERSDGSFCVWIEEISALEFRGIRVWGSGLATGSRNIRERR